MSDEEIKNCFIIGYLYDIGYEFTENGIDFDGVNIPNFIDTKEAKEKAKKKAEERAKKEAEKKAKEEAKKSEAETK